MERKKRVPTLFGISNKRKESEKNKGRRKGSLPSLVPLSLLVLLFVLVRAYVAVAPVYCGTWDPVFRESFAGLRPSTQSCCVLLPRSPKCQKGIKVSLLLSRNSIQREKKNESAVVSARKNELSLLRHAVKSSQIKQKKKCDDKSTMYPQRKKV